MSRRGLIAAFLSAVIMLASVATLVLRSRPTALGCPGSSITPIVDCHAVVSSSAGLLFGLPLGAWALMWLVGWWVQQVVIARQPTGVMWAAVGLFGVAYAVGTELRLDHLCGWCTLNQAAILALIFSRWPAIPRRRGAP